MTLDATILPQVLAKAVYTSGIFGKWHLGDEELTSRTSADLMRFSFMVPVELDRLINARADAPGNKYFNPTIRHNGTFAKTEGYCTDLFFTAALGWMHRVKEKNDPSLPT